MKIIVKSCERLVHPMRENADDRFTNQQSNPVLLWSLLGSSIATCREAFDKEQFDALKAKEAALEGNRIRVNTHVLLSESAVSLSFFYFFSCYLIWNILCCVL